MATAEASRMLCAIRVIGKAQLGTAMWINDSVANGVEVLAGAGTIQGMN